MGAIPSVMPMSGGELVPSEIRLRILGEPGGDGMDLAYEGERDDDGFSGWGGNWRVRRWSGGGAHGTRAGGVRRGECGGRVELCESGVWGWCGVDAREVCGAWVSQGARCEWRREVRLADGGGVVGCAEVFSVREVDFRSGCAVAGGDGVPDRGAGGVLLRVRGPPLAAPLCKPCGDRDRCGDCDIHGLCKCGGGVQWGAPGVASACSVLWGAVTRVRVASIRVRAGVCGQRSRREGVV